MRKVLLIFIVGLILIVIGYVFLGKKAPAPRSYLQPIPIPLVSGPVPTSHAPQYLQPVTPTPVKAGPTSTSKVTPKAEK